jgi:hypothetical protein
MSKKTTTPTDLAPSIEPAESRIAVGRPRGHIAIGISEVNSFVEEFKETAQYKIEVHFGKDRSTHAPCTGALLIWESGRRLHGGGDEKMYWCGWKDCGKPIKTENFAHMHVVCPSCQKESFLDEVTKEQHIRYMKKEGRDPRDIEILPIVVGERFFKMSPPNIASLLVKTFEELQRNADVYLKFHPLDIRYIGKDETTADINKLIKARERREPLIYPLRRIIKDVTAGADLHARFLAMITA